MTNRIERIELGILEGTRPRPAGKNARLDEHGSTIRLPIARITTTDGATGFGVTRASREHLSLLAGLALDDAYHPGHGVTTTGLPLEFPIWDLVAKQQHKPVYQVIARDGFDTSTPFRVPCYDTSLYFDSLHLESEEEAAALIGSEVEEGLARGHRHFKIKVGRGARHLPLEAGTARDIRIIQTVRETAGPEARLMIDANNGYNLNLTKRVLAETANCNLYWLEEAFHEDPVLYRDLKCWLLERNLPVLIGDGEGDASSHVMEWAREGLIDVVQYDIIHPGFTRWLELGRQLDAWDVASAPHHYGTLYGNYVTGHLATAISGFQFVEWDHADAPGLDTSAYSIDNGYLTIPNAPGFGLILDEERFAASVAADGITLTAD